MTLTNPCVLYQSEGESAGGASTFEVQNMETGRTGRKGRRLPSSWANLKSHRPRLFFFHLTGEIQVRPEWGLPRSAEKGAGSLSQILQSLPLEMSMHQPCC